IRLSESCPAESGEGHVPDGDVGRGGLRGEILQPTVAASHHGNFRDGSLNLPGNPKMAHDSQQRMFWGVVAIDWRKFGRPDNVRVGVGIAHRDIDHADSPVAEHSRDGNRLSQVLYEMVETVGTER